eukprot:9287798-Alexandrium_andersonii.AAC.1
MRTTSPRTFGPRVSLSHFRTASGQFFGIRMNKRRSAGRSSPWRKAAVTSKVKPSQPTVVMMMRMIRCPMFKAVGLYVRYSPASGAT